MTCQKIKLYPYFIPLTKINLKWIKNLNIRLEKKKKKTCNCCRNQYSRNQAPHSESWRTQVCYAGGPRGVNTPELWSLPSPPGSLLEKLVLRTASVSLFPRSHEPRPGVVPGLPHQPLPNLQVNPRSSQRHTTQSSLLPEVLLTCCSAPPSFSCSAAHTASGSPPQHLHPPPRQLYVRMDATSNFHVSSPPPLTAWGPSFPGF